jgi:hypothetical protein
MSIPELDNWLKEDWTNFFDRCRSTLKSNVDEIHRSGINPYGYVFLTSDELALAAPVGAFNTLEDLEGSKDDKYYLGDKFYPGEWKHYQHQQYKALGNYFDESILKKFHKLCKSRDRKADDNDHDDYLNEISVYEKQVLQKIYQIYIEVLKDLRTVKVFDNRIFLGVHVLGDQLAINYQSVLTLNEGRIWREIKPLFEKYKS